MEGTIQNLTSINGITPTSLWIFFVVLLGILLTYNTAMSALQHHRKNQDRSSSAQRETSQSLNSRFDSIQNDIQKINEKLIVDKRRIENLESKASFNDRQMRILLRSQMAMLHHMVDGNNISKLQQCYAEIEDFLTGGIHDA